MTGIKVCGLTRAADVEACLALGVERLGLNLVPASPRAIDVATARALASTAAGKAAVVLVVANLPVAEVRALLDATGADLAQLHGDEPVADVVALAPRAMKAVRIGDARDVEHARAFPGPLLVDAKVAGVLGGSGATFDWSLVRGLADERELTLAGGLRADNVKAAVHAVRPRWVDVAGGVEAEGTPREKCPSRLEAFVRAVRG